MPTLRAEHLSKQEPPRGSASEVTFSALSWRLHPKHSGPKFACKIPPLYRYADEFDRKLAFFPKSPDTGNLETGCLSLHRRNSDSFGDSQTFVRIACF
jgi:hypothetical protein